MALKTAIVLLAIPQSIESFAAWGPSTYKMKTAATTGPYITRFMSTESETNKERILDDISELTTSFQQVQETIRLSSKLYDETLSEYEDRILEYDDEVSSLKKTMEMKNEEIETLQKNSVESEGYKGQIKNLEADVLSAKKSIELKDAEISNFKTKLDEAKEVVEEVSSLRKTIEMKNEEIQTLQKNSVEMEDKEKIKKLEAEVLSLKESIQLKDEEIKNFKTKLVEAKQILEEASFEDERDELAREKEALENKVDYLKKNIQAEVTKGLVRASSEKIDLQLNMDSTIKVRDDLIKDLKVKIEGYESERGSLRKLTALGFVRFATILRLRRKKKDD